MELGWFLKNLLNHPLSVSTPDSDIGIQHRRREEQFQNGQRKALEAMMGVGPPVGIVPGIFHQPPTLVPPPGAPPPAPAPAAAAPQHAMGAAPVPTSSNAPAARELTEEEQNVLDLRLLHEKVLETHFVAGVKRALDGKDPLGTLGSKDKGLLKQLRAREPGSYAVTKRSFPGSGSMNHI